MNLWFTKNKTKSCIRWSPLVISIKVSRSLKNMEKLNHSIGVVSIPFYATIIVSKGTDAYDTGRGR